ncbi:hypothetical protein PRZ48_004088 [Zasmidium cellare]|uniref:Uncharacterized protein n=1 Tax=Zasmidium cellare TaxID=395010 RepID=A0ABR0EZ87_ZASCE|nr:hypothetical protein PRZ48_004088 [Zasmidium cellare]
MASNGSKGNERRRSGREKHLSDKARSSLDVGEQIPGLDQPPPTPLSQLWDPSADSNLQDFSFEPKKAQPATATKMTRNKKSKPTAVAAPDSATSPAFAANSFLLNGWPRELPEDLDELHSKWEDRKDQATTADIIETYGDDGADDWDDFAGNPDLYPEDGDLERAVGSTFVNRAKRAFRGNKSWEQFEADEVAINSMRVAMVEHDPARHKILLRECLNNDLRLKIFNQLKRQLCADIWKEEYMPRADEVVAVSSSSRTKKDSKVSFTDEDSQDRKKQAGPVEPDAYSVKQWDGMLPVWNESGDAEETGRETILEAETDDDRAHVKHTREGQLFRRDCGGCKAICRDTGYV